MKNIILFAFLLSLQVASLAQQPGSFCVSEDELALWEQINTYRLKFALDPLPLSKSLSYVAYLHVRDLYLNHPDEGDCNLHSWSDNGTWKPICFPEEQSRTNSPWNNPPELANYKGKAMEIAYYENNDALPENILEMWKMSSPSASVMVNTGKWNRYDWKAIGVAIYRGYAVAWFGDAEDAYDGIRVCNSDRMIFKEENSEETQSTAEKSDKIPVILNPTSQFYLIYGSFDNEIQAMEKAKDYKTKGFKDVAIISADRRFRIALQPFKSEEEAKEAKASFPAEFRSAWVLEF